MSARVNYSNILVTFDLYFTSQGEAKMCVLYTTNNWATYVVLPITRLRGQSHVYRDQHDFCQYRAGHLFLQHYGSNLL